MDHNGEFTCTASSGQMEKSASASLKVYGGCTENLLQNTQTEINKSYSL